jgi:hypothetical protein
MADEQILKAVAVLDDKMSAELRQLSGQVNTFQRQNAQAAAQTQRSFDQMQRSVAVVGREVRTVLTPAMTALGLSTAGVAASIVGFGRHRSRQQSAGDKISRR